MQGQSQTGKQRSSALNNNSYETTNTLRLQHTHTENRSRRSRGRLPRGQHGSEAADAFEGGLAGLTVLQLAALRAGSDTALCTALLARGADSAPLASLAPELVARHCTSGALPVPLRPVCDGDGAPLDCPICMEPVLALTAEWTPCCVKAFHAHCVAGLKACPMCRTALAAAPDAPLGARRPAYGSTPLEVMMNSRGMRSSR